VVNPYPFSIFSVSFRDIFALLFLPVPTACQSQIYFQ
jgi:hypothetical protein